MFVLFAFSGGGGGGGGQMRKQKPSWFVTGVFLSSPQIKKKAFFPTQFFHIKNCVEGLLGQCDPLSNLYPQVKTCDGTIFWKKNQKTARCCI